MHCKNSPCPAQGVNGHFSIRPVAVAPVRGRTPSPLTPPDTVRGSAFEHTGAPAFRQEGAGAAQWLSPRTMQALETIRPENANPVDRIFGLKTTQSIYERIQKAALAAGLGDGYSGHSLRVGMIYDMVDADIPAPAIIIAAHWKTPNMLAHYTRYIDATRGAVAQLYADKPRQIKQVIRRRPPVVVRYLENGPDPYRQNLITAGA